MPSIYEHHSLIKNKFLDFYNNAKSQINEFDIRINETLVKAKDAAAAGDLSENAAYHDAQDQLQKLIIQKEYYSTILEDIEPLLEEMNKEYVSRGIVCEFCTVFLENTSNSNRYEFGIFPSSLSKPLDNIMSTKCRAYKAMRGKKAGDTFQVMDRHTGRYVTFKILEVY